MHSFSKYNVGAEQLVAKQTLKHYLAVLFKQANSPEGAIPYNDVEPSDDQKIKAPRYYGAGGEFLSYIFFKTFGHAYNVHNVLMTDDVEVAKEDGGCDGEAACRVSKLYDRKTMKILTSPGSPVFIQVKTTTNSQREFTTNDGSNIMNFFGNAQMKAAITGHSFQARYILWTTGKSLGWKLVENTGGFIEVISYSEIAKKIDNDPVFWNNVREAFNLPILPTPISTADPLFIAMQQEIKDNIY